MSVPHVFFIERLPAILDGMKRRLLTPWDAKVIAGRRSLGRDFEPIEAAAGSHRSFWSTTPSPITSPRNAWRPTRSVSIPPPFPRSNIPGILIYRDRIPHYVRDAGTGAAALENNIAVLNKRQAGVLEGLAWVCRTTDAARGNRLHRLVSDLFLHGMSRSCTFRRNLLRGDPAWVRLLAADFLQDPTHVLDRRFLHAKLIGYLLVEHDLRQHHQHPY